MIVAILLIAACRTAVKKQERQNNTKPSSENNSQNFVLSKPPIGKYVPGEPELAAIQTQYKEVTMEQLQSGYELYNQGACINCHGAKDIYQFETADWKEIIDEMAKKARITPSQKDDVYKYVLAVKAVQSK